MEATEPFEVVVQHRREGLQTTCSHAELYQPDDAVGQDCLTHNITTTATTCN